MRRVLDWLPAVAGSYAIVAGLLTIVGWALDLPRLADWTGDQIAMQPNTALSAIMMGAAVILVAAGFRAAAACLGATVLAIGAITLLEHVSGIDSGINRVLLFDRPWGSRATLAPGRMGIPAATSWALTGFAVLLLRRPGRTHSAVPLIGLLVSAIAGLSLIGYLFGADMLYTLPRFTAIAMQTGTVLLLLGFAFVAMAPESQPVRTLLEDSTGSEFARRALPIVILLPIGLGFLCVRGQVSGLYDASMGIALLVLSLILILCSILWWSVSAVIGREDSLRRSEERFSRFMEHLPGLAWIKDHEGRYLYVNEAAERTFGVARESLYGKTDFEVFSQETAAQFRLNDREALETGLGKQVIETLAHEDGIIHHSIVSKFPISVRSGESRLIGGMAIDITDRKRAEETVNTLLRISRRLNSTLSVDGLLDILVLEAMSLIGAEGGVSGLLTSMGMVSTRYFHKGDVLPLEYCWPPMHGLPGWLSVNKKPYVTNSARTDSQIVRELCEQFDVRSAISIPIMTAQDDIIGFFEVHNKTDGTEFLPSDQELLVSVAQAAAPAVQNALAYRSLQEAEKSLKLSDRRKDEFLAVLAHELRNPLAPIRNGLEIIKRAQGDPLLLSEAQSAMDRQISHLVRLVDDLLDLSRINHDKLALRKEPVELTTIIRQAVEATQPLADRENQSIRFVSSDDPIPLNADPVRLAQVFANLLHNACKFSPPQSEIAVSVIRDANDAVISVKDPGIGIPRENLGQVFEMFAQAHHSTDRPHGGLGIGLTLVKRLVEMHSGTTCAKSDGRGRGSEFIVRLPVAAEKALPPPTVPTTPRQHRDSRKVLVVDDNRDSAATLGSLMRLIGHETVLAHDGVEACEAADAHRPSIILLDIGMPRMNGHDACRAIRQTPWGRDAIIIALTGWGQDDDRRLSAEAGFDGHLVKPVDCDALLKLLTEKQTLQNRLAELD